MAKNMFLYSMIVVVIIAVISVTFFIQGNFQQESTPKFNDEESCDSTNPCPEGEQCYAFPGDDAPVCLSGDPCEECDSKNCVLAESDPPLVICQIV
ncbi:hypothetical protein CMO88_01220 [Candidatus Woesearchaeota archaeon]|nr:hypothetical protein [Candidatus Woesearchaeota archaeon]